MLSRIVVATFALSLGAALDCSSAATKLVETHTACSDNTTQCMAAPATCQAFIENMTDAVIDDMITGFGTCNGSDGSEASFFIYAGYPAGYFKRSVEDDAHRCGLADKIVFTAPAIDTCAGALSAFITYPCPKQCSDDSGDALPECTDGQEERSPASCGGAACRDFIASFDDAKLASFKEGMAACNQSSYVGWQHLAGLEWAFLAALPTVAEDCGHEDDVTWSPIPMDTCMGAYMPISKFDAKCPKKCDSDDRRRLDGRRLSLPADDRHRLDGRRLSLPACTDGEDEYDPSSCGASAAPKCQAFLGMFKNNMDDITTGLASCTGALAFIAPYAPLMESQIKNTTADCGYNFDDLPNLGDASKGPSALMCINRLALLLLALVGIFLN